MPPVVIAEHITAEATLPIGVYIAIGTVVYILLVYLLLCFRQSKRESFNNCASCCSPLGAPNDCCACCITLSQTCDCATPNLTACCDSICGPRRLHGGTVTVPDQKIHCNCCGPDQGLSRLSLLSTIGCCTCNNCCPDITPCCEGIATCIRDFTTCCSNCHLPKCQLVKPGQQIVCCCFVLS